MSLILKDILQTFPHISLASEADNDELLNYYHQTELAAKTNTVIYKRGKDFFKFLKERSEHFLVFTLRDNNKKLHGVAVVSFRPGYIDGVLQTVGFLGDLRVSLNRSLVREWRKFYGLFLEKSPELPETNYCRHYQTALMSENRYSKNNLADTKIANLYYKDLAPYQMVNIVGRMGWRFKIEPHVRWARPDDIEAIIKFLNKDHKSRLFGHDWSQEFERRLKHWPHFSIADYIVITGDHDNLLAVTSVWNPIDSKQILVKHIPPLFKTLSLISAAIPGVQLKPLPRKMQPIDILYLNQISFAHHLSTSDQAVLFGSIIALAFTRSFNILAYCDFDREGLCKKTKNLITQKNHLGFFTVHYKSNDGKLRDDLFLSENDLSPAFDMALV